jgi:4-carboxymuconolactone decarboxylase
MKLRSTLSAAMALIIPQSISAQTPPAPQRSATAAMQAIAPDLGRYTDDVLFGDVWLRPGLPPRDRSLLSVTALVVKGSTGPLERHITRALNNGVKPREIVGLITHLAFYVGWPNASGSIEAAQKVFEQRGIDKVALNAPVAPLKPGNAADPYRDRLVAQLGAASPKLAELTTKTVFDDLWTRSDLAVRDRCLITIAAMITSGSVDDVAYYGDLCRKNGLSDAERGEALTHLAFYAGWPNVIAASRLMTPQAGMGAPAAGSAAALTVYKTDPNVAGAPSANFTGLMKGHPPFALTGNEVMRGSAVTFQPGARTKWHSHPHGQLLIVTVGQGWVQSDGAAVQKVVPGDVIWTPPGVRHWHGATQTDAMTHIAISQRDDTREVTWQEPVSEADYSGPR